MSKKHTIPKKILSSKLLRLKMSLLTEHSVMMYQHMDKGYMRQRAKEEILNNGDLTLAQTLLLMSDIKAQSEFDNESKNSKV